MTETTNLKKGPLQIVLNKLYTAVIALLVLSLQPLEVAGQKLMGNYVIEDPIPEVAIKYSFNEPDRFTFSDHHSHNHYFGQGYYLIDDDQIHLYYDKNCGGEYYSEYEILTSVQAKKTKLFLVVTDKKKEVVPPIIRVTKPETGYSIQATGYNTRIVELDYVSMQDTLKIGCPGYYPLEIPLYQFKSQEVVFLINLQMDNNAHPISGTHEKRKFKLNKKGFLMEYEGEMRQFVKE
ncbi:hypothetical protein JMN32_14800 [Fulvivirga sp. 29W222]|uniref:Uncharacterized protein n=1 Tax=Fulvivirga marina TaxID=2494733 RepID=A0A937G076_9BACT|nr:hypothetical protein [Fulvivirga marina]MBL6447585.1 hypothetical protein [Fulvivirga marina]